VSQITFPTYFLKDSSDVVKIQTKMDTEIFATYYKPVFNITRRYVGTEPYCEVTKAYNEMMKLVLPKYGIEVIEVERKAINGQVISASSIRELLKKRNFQALKRLVPQTTYDYLTNPEIIDKLRENQGRH
jgi:[citrate (pro-3S)-lyase] ligase